MAMSKYQIPKRSMEEIRTELVAYLKLVGPGEIAERAGVTTSAVLKWRERNDDFPAPIAELQQGPVWRWADVEPWIKSRKKRGRPKAD
jgi:predicted DNA-binding transcriptional regulator AlpA